MVAGPDQAHQGSVDRRHTGGLGAADLGTFQQRQAVLEHLYGRVVEPRIDKARLVAGEAAVGPLGAVIGEALGQIERLGGFHELRARDPPTDQFRRDIPVLRILGHGPPPYKKRRHKGRGNGAGQVRTPVRAPENCRRRKRPCHWRAGRARALRLWSGLASVAPMTHAHAAGILPCQTIEQLIVEQAITSATPFDADQVQPASLDLRLGARAWRIRASFLPAGPARCPSA